MQVTLKQSDIEKSLKDYITAQGIRTEGKKVEIIFTAGRRGTGVTAEITIEDVLLGTNPVLVISDECTKSPVIQEADLMKCGPAVAYAETQGPANEPEAEVVPVKSVSLFG